MAILQVHQAKALKQVHEGSTDPGLMQELRTATDFALRATKVTSGSPPSHLAKVPREGDVLMVVLMVVQECHLWLNLAGGSPAVPVLHEEIAVLLAKDAIEPVPPAEMRQGFHSPYFIVPKKSGQQPILDQRVSNRACTSSRSRC